MRLLLYLSAFLVLMICCKKTNNEQQVFSSTGTIAGSDTTCGGWLIRVNDSTTFDPLNIDSFLVTKKDGQAVSFKYQKPQGVIMICLMGQPIKLISIQDQ